MEDGRIVGGEGWQKKYVTERNGRSSWKRGRPRNRWQDEVMEDGRIVGGEGWQKKYITERNGRSS
jgi:hypothetical protein